MLSKKNKVAVKIYYELDDNINDTMDFIVRKLKRLLQLASSAAAAAELIKRFCDE